jgi:hypothetical protein
MGMITRSLWQGAVAGVTGAVVMAVTEKIEQSRTGRPSSYAPARVLERLLGRPEQRGKQPDSWNWAMHTGQAAAVGVVRGLMANAGLRGPWASAMFTVVRLTSDQILENATGVGAPPWTWPRHELAVDLLHKSVYGFATGAIADALAARSGPGPGQMHAAKDPGRRSGVGPISRRRSLAR